MVHDGPASYSALPHGLLFDRRLSDAAVRLYAVLQAHWWQSGECFASHATLAEQMGVQERQIRRLIRELVGAGYVAERRRGHGQAKAYAPIQQDKNDRLNGSEMSAYEPPKRTKMTGQQDKNDRFKRTKMSARRRSTEEDTSGRKKTENVVPGVSGTAVVAGAARATVAAAGQKATKVAFSSLSEDARRVVDDWRSKQGKARPPTFNPTQAAYLEEAVTDLGVPRLLEANTWAAQNGVPEFVKAIRAARTKRQRDEDDGVSAPAPHVNGTLAKATPPTDEDRALWDRALEAMRPTITASNFAAYLAPLELAGRGEDGGLWLVVNPAAAEHTARFKHHISRALEDAGDRHATAVRFKARRSRGNDDAE